MGWIRTLYHNLACNPYWCIQFCTPMIKYLYDILCKVYFVKKFIEYQISNRFTKYVTLTVLHFLIGISSHTSSSTTRHFCFLGQSMIIFLKHFIWGTGLHLMEQIVRWYYSWCSMWYSNNRRTFFNFSTLCIFTIFT